MQFINQLSVHAMMAAAVMAAGILSAQEAGAPSTQQGAGAAQLQKGSAGEFIQQAAQANAAEIALAEVAQRKAQNPQVKQFAQQMLREHTQANLQLQPIARTHGVTINQPLATQHQQKMDKLQQSSGAEFDKEFMKTMLKDHQQVITKFEQASKEVQAADVKQYAQTTLPKLREHLQHAKQAAQAAGMDEAAISAALKESSDAMGGAEDQVEKEAGAAEQAAPEVELKQDQAPERDATP